MLITRSAIETRLADAKKQLESLQQQYIATTGVIADLEYWLTEDAKPDPPAEPPTKD